MRKARPARDISRCIYADKPVRFLPGKALLGERVVLRERPRGLDSLKNYGFCESLRDPKTPDSREVGDACGVQALAGDDLPFPVRVGRNQDVVIPMLFKKRNDASGRVFQRGGRLADERLGNYGKVSPAFEQRAVRLRLGKAEQMSDAVCDDGLSVGTPVAFFRRRETATERGGEIFCHAGFSVSISTKTSSHAGRSL